MTPNIRFLDCVTHPIFKPTYLTSWYSISYIYPACPKLSQYFSFLLTCYSSCAPYLSKETYILLSYSKEILSSSLTPPSFLIPQHSVGHCLCRTSGLCQKYPTLQLQRKNNHRQYINEWAWLCSNKTSFTKTDSELIWPTGRSLLNPGLNN